MSLLSTLPGTLSLIITLINQAYLAIIAAIWYYVVYFGLSPSYSFPVYLQNDGSFIAFFSALYNNIYLTLAGLMLLIGSSVLIASNSLGKIHFPSSLLYRTLFALILSYFSFQISILIMRFFLDLFLQLWNYNSMNWFSLFSVTNSVKQIRMSYSENPFFAVMEFLLLSLYFSGTGALLAILELRQALVIFLMLTLPMFSLFFMIKGLDYLAVKFWKLFVEINALPFFILLILFNVHFFPGNFLLQAAFIILAATSPYLIVTSNSILSSGATSLMNPGEFLGTAVANPATSIGRFVGSSRTGNKPFKGMRLGSEGPATFKGQGPGSYSLSDIALSDELRYHRFEVNPDED